MANIVGGLVVLVVAAVGNVVVRRLWRLWQRRRDVAEDIELVEGAGQVARREDVVAAVREGMLAAVREAVAEVERERGIRVSEAGETGREAPV